MPVAAALPFIIAGGATIAGSAIGANAAGNASNAQVNAANNAANLQHLDAQQALDFQKQQYGNSLRMMAPYYGMGTNSLNRLGFLMGMPQQQVTFDPNNPNPGQTAPPPPGGGWGGNTAILPDASHGPGIIRANALGMTRSDGSTVGPGGVGSITSASTGQPGDIQTNGTPTAGTSAGAAGSTLFSANGSPAIGGNPADGTSGGAMTRPGDGSIPGSSGGEASLFVPDGSGAGGGFGSLATPFGEQFKAPTDVTEQNDPGYKFRLQQGLDAMQNSAAARGGLGSGGTAKALQDYAQGTASSEYGNVYNRAMGEYLNRFNINRANQTDLFNRFASMAGIGQTSAEQLMNAGQGAANNASNILLTSGGQIGQNINNAGAARGSGYVGAGNAIAGGISGLGNLAMLYSILNKSNPGASTNGGWA